MISKEQMRINDSRTVFEKAFDFEDYMMRRTLGLYYIAWAIAFFLFVLPNFVYTVMDKFYWSYLLLYLGIYAIEILYTGYLFERAFKVYAIARAFRKKRGTGMVNTALVIFILAFFCLAIVFEFHSYFALLFAASAVYVPWAILRIAKKTLSRIYTEIWLAISSYVVASIASILSIVVLNNFSLLEIIWIPTGIVWAGCGIAGIYFADYQSLVIKDDE